VIKLLERVYEYVKDNEFRFTVFDNKIHIINYKRIITLEDNYISFYSPNNKISITGNNLSLIKLLDKEMLIKGTITKIEVSND
jgi:sporulation protein YqfC